MTSPFEGATRAAIEEIISKHATDSKFGLLLNKENLRAVCSELYELLLTSRNLKSLGDRMLAGDMPATSRRQGSSGPNFR